MAGETNMVEESNIWNCDLSSIDMTQFPRPDMAYTDPPWGQANLTCWSNKAKVTRQEWLKFLSDLVRVLSFTRGYVFIEMGLRWVEQLKRAVASQEGIMLKEWIIAYYRTRPVSLLCVTWNKTLKEPTFDFTGHDDRVTTYHAVKNFSKEGDLIFDPCLGLATTAIAALAQRRRILGFEINKTRFEAARNVIQRWKT